MNEVSENGLQEYRSKIHLSPAQLNLLRQFRDAYSERPSFDQYEHYQKLMLKVDPSEKLTLKKIPNTRPGFGSKEIKLEPGFDARKDLPQGWGVYSFYDSGSNCGVRSAGQIVLTYLWNYWDMKNSNTRKILEGENNG